MTSGKHEGVGCGEKLSKFFIDVGKKTPHEFSPSFNTAERGPRRLEGNSVLSWRLQVRAGKFKDHL